MIARIGVGLFCLLTLAAQAASLPPTGSADGLVVSAQRLAAEAGVDMLRQGGNAIDAAVAVAYAEAVVNPCCGNIGGGGFLVAHLPDPHLPEGRNIFLNFRETAPAAATRDMFLGADGQPIPGASLNGWKSTAVPGSVLGLDTALARYGTMPRAVVMAQAVKLARQGFILTAADADILARGAHLLRQNPNAARIFLHPDGSPLAAGDRLHQPDLAQTLQAISDQGPDAFYHGKIPEAVEAASRAGGGIITAEDFATYRVTEEAPVTCAYRGHVIESAPPPSSGGVTICEILNFLEGYDLVAMGFHAADAVHVMAEAFRLAFFDRSTYLGDPRFVQAPLTRLLDKDYATRLRGLVGEHAMTSASLGPAVRPLGEKPETTHFSVLDQRGGAAAVTYTLNGGFGTGIIAGDTGFLLNNEMDDFTIAPRTPNQFGVVQGEANVIAPGKRPLSSMAPTIVLKPAGAGADGSRNDQVEMVLGSPGGPRIITAVVETIMNMIDYGMDAQEAVDAPRMHLQWLPDILYVEPFALSPDTRPLLERMGYHIQVQKPSGAVELIASGSLAHPKGTAVGSDSAATPVPAPNMFYGANDSRRPAGAALAP